MQVGSLRVRLLLRQSQSLKDKRQVVRSVLERLRNGFNVAATEVEVCVLGSERDQSVTLHGLRSAAGFIQSKVCERMKSRYVPVLEFVLDEGIKNSLEVARLLHEEKAREQKTEDSEQETEDRSQ